MFRKLRGILLIAEAMIRFGGGIIVEVKYSSAFGGVNAAIQLRKDPNEKLEIQEWDPSGPSVVAAHATTEFADLCKEFGVVSKYCDSGWD